VLPLVRARRVARRAWRPAAVSHPLWSSQALPGLAGTSQSSAARSRESRPRWARVHLLHARRFSLSVDRSPGTQEGHLLARVAFEIGGFGGVTPPVPFQRPLPRSAHSGGVRRPRCSALRACRRTA